ncbi:MAG: PQQ-binding-like beta-propeller repeat protein [Candidatus Aenigmarchaeota archaeon]|nr:PQQ-binding-like beta-propeller repeat protein [Candidatus Aenigmarchaeota archaeon]
MHYPTGKGVEIAVNVQIPQFQDLQTVGSVAYQKEVLKKDVLYNIGTGGSILAKVVVYDGTVYFGCFDHNFYAVDAETGKEMWRFATKGPACARAEAVFTDQMIYFPSFDGNLYGVGFNGKGLFRFSAEDKISYTPLVTEEAIYFGCKDGNLYAVSKDGRLLWKFPTKGPIMSEPKLLDDTIWFGSSDGNVYGISLKGRLRHAFSTRDQIAGSVVTHKGRIYFGSFDGNLYCLNPDAKLLWTFATNGPVYNPVAHDGVIYAGSWDGNFYAIDAENGNLLWKFPLQGLYFTWARIHEGRIYFGCWDNNLYCLDFKGKLVWKFATNGQPTTPFISSNKIYFGSYDCNLYCLSLHGRLLWKFPTSTSTYSTYGVEEAAAEQSINVVWQPETIAKTDERYRGPKIEMQDESAYTGGFSGYASSETRYMRKKGYR